MPFLILAPPLTPRTQLPLLGGGLGVWGCAGGGGGGGVKTSLPMAVVVCEFKPGSRGSFFLKMDPLTHGVRPGSQLPVPTVTPLHALLDPGAVDLVVVWGPVDNKTLRTN